MGWIRVDSLEGITQKEADFAAGVLFAIPLVSLAQPVKFWFDLPNAGQLLTLLLSMEIRAGKLVSHGLRPGERPEGELTHTCACIDKHRDWYGETKHLRMIFMKERPIVNDFD